jgi:hypothetical protein
MRWLRRRTRPDQAPDPVPVGSDITLDDVTEAWDDPLDQAAFETWVHAKLVAGFHTCTQLLAAGGKYATDAGLSVAPATASILRLWDERVRQQRHWPAVTDADRLERAFAALTGDGVVSRMNFTCCRTCGEAEIADEVPTGAVPDGYVFFHNQDADQLEPGRLHLAWGVFAPYADEAAYEHAMHRIGNRIVDALGAQGLTVEWDGRPEHRITLTGLVWRRRLPADPATSLVAIM